MEKESRAMCHACGRKVATHHIYQPGAEPPSMSLCSDCVETNASAPVQAFMEKLKSAVCRFCGGRATSTSMFPTGGTGYQRDFDFVCQFCLAESQRLFLAKLDEWGMTLENFPDLVEMKQCQQLLEDLDAQMRRWVSQRDN